jgi:hypothetical protein
MQSPRQPERPGHEAELFTIDLPDGKKLPFHLYRRTLPMARAGELDYFWLDTRSFRGGPGMANLQSCLDLCWEFARTHFPNDTDRLVDLVLAELFPVTNRSKAAHDAFLSAQLRPGADREVELPERERSSIVRAVDSEDPARVRRKFGDLLAGERPAARQMAKYNGAFQDWMGRAAIAFKQCGRDAVRGFVGEKLKACIDANRKRGNNPEGRTFINLLAHTARVAFYGCYHTTWNCLLTVLPQQFGLSPASVRFLRFWHLVADDVETDVFWGQPLALHPLSEFVMRQEEHRVAIGEWLAQSPEDGNAIGDWKDPSYRGAVKSILTAASEYTHVYERETRSRKQPKRAKSRAVSHKRTTPSRKSKVSKSALDPGKQAQSLIFDLYAQTTGILCPECNGAVEYENHRATEDKHVRGVEVTYRCRNCKGTTTCLVEPPRPDQSAKPSRHRRKNPGERD